MERSQLFDLMGELQLHGMKAAFDEIMATAVKRQHEPQRIIGDLLAAEISEKQARSIKYQLTIAKLPLAKDLDDFQFEGTPINEALVRDLAGGGFLAQQRNAVLVGGTGTGKTHLVIAIARSCIRAGARGRFYNVVDLVNRLESEARNGRQGRLADHLTRMDFVVLDELGYLPDNRVERRPAAILAADVAGYSAPDRSDEEGVLARLKVARESCSRQKPALVDKSAIKSRPEMAEKQKNRCRQPNLEPSGPCFRP
jgi:DNA replication protein DnaC